MRNTSKLAVNVVLALAISFSLASSSIAAQTKSTATRPGATPQSGDVGLGVVFGEPTGLTLKSWISGVHAFDIALSYSFFEFFQLNGDYLWHFKGALTSLTKGGISDEFIPYAGIGGVLLFDISPNGTARGRFFGERNRSDVAFGLRFPLGVEFLPRKAPFGVFAELALGLGMTPTTFGFLEGGIGGRFYF